MGRCAGGACAVWLDHDTRLGDEEKRKVCWKGMRRPLVVDEDVEMSMRGYECY